MALVILGESTCPLCLKVMENGNEIIGFPAFVINDNDPLLGFNDSTFHRSCFALHPLASAVLERMAFRSSKIGPGNRVCEVCWNIIETPGEYFALGHLVDDESNPMSRLNYLQAHRQCLKTWDETSSIRKMLVDLRESEMWSGDGLDSAIEELDEALYK